MRAISQIRFDAMISYCRRPQAKYLMRELAWFEAGNERVLASLVVDTDGQYSGLVLARDLNERFRWIGQTNYKESPEEAVVELQSVTYGLLANLDDHRSQGDETGEPVDFFTPVAEENRLNTGFRTLLSNPGFAPARGIVSEMMRWHEDVDGNFIQQFQTDGFDARIWELYLFAALKEAGLEITRPSPAPDFICTGPPGAFALEATTVNPTIVAGKPAESARPETEDEIEKYVQHYLPIKFAGPLTAKLQKKYWEKSPTKGKPFVIGIQDFHDSMSMAYSRPGLVTYLYGYVHEQGESDKDAPITTRRVREHQWYAKTVPSAFFSQPGAENISAVIFNASATLSKFNRMGVSAGFSARDVVLIRRGFAFHSDPSATTPIPYVHFVSEGYAETWTEGLEVFHNPYASMPLDPAYLPHAVHNHILDDGQMQSHTAGWAPLSSVTSVLQLPS